MTSPKVGYFYERITASGRHILAQVRNVREPRLEVEEVEIALWSTAGLWLPLAPCINVLKYTLWLSQVEQAKLARRQLPVRVRLRSRTMIEIQNPRKVVHLVAIRKVMKRGIDIVTIGRIARRVCAGIWSPLKNNGLLPTEGLKQQARAAAVARQEEMRTT